MRTAIRAIGGLVAELKGLVPPDDVVYLSFGLNMPGAQAVPSVPTNLTAMLRGTAATLKWDASSLFQTVN